MRQNLFRCDNCLKSETEQPNEALPVGWVSVTKHERPGTLSAHGYPVKEFHLCSPECHRAFHARQIELLYEQYATRWGKKE